MKKNIFLICLFFINLIISQEKDTYQKDNEGNLIGKINRSLLQEEPFNIWFTENYNEYTLDSNTVSNIKPLINNFKIKALMGTWCGDSKRETPRFFKILDATNFDEKNLEIFGVDRNKKTPDSLEIKYNIIRVPTFIFYKDDREVGRYVEYPRKSLEKDILKILTGKPYKHSYDN